VIIVTLVEITGANFLALVVYFVHAVVPNMMALCC
jgi:hypothetical protein